MVIPALGGSPEVIALTTSSDLIMIYKNACVTHFAKHFCKWISCIQEAHHFVAFFKIVLRISNILICDDLYTMQNKKNANQFAF